MEPALDKSIGHHARGLAYNREYMRKRRQDPDFRRRCLAKDKERKRTRDGKQKHLISASRCRAKKAGIEHTITWHDVHWPTRCPVLGIELNYSGGQGAHQPNTASLDRWDNDKGYVPGNVRVISLRANVLKKDGTWQELLAVAQYARYGGPPPGLEDIW